MELANMRWFFFASIVTRNHVFHNSLFTFLMLVRKCHIVQGSFLPKDTVNIQMTLSNSKYLNLFNFNHLQYSNFVPENWPSWPQLYVFGENKVISPMCSGGKWKTKAMCKDPQFLDRLCSIHPIQAILDLTDFLSSKFW